MRANFIGKTKDEGIMYCRCYFERSCRLLTSARGYLWYIYQTIQIIGKKYINSSTFAALLRAPSLYLQYICIFIYVFTSLYLTLILVIIIIVASVCIEKKNCASGVDPVVMNLYENKSSVPLQHGRRFLSNCLKMEEVGWFSCLIFLWPFYLRFGCFYSPPIILRPAHYLQRSSMPAYRMLMSVPVRFNYLMHASLKCSSGLTIDHKLAGSCTFRRAFGMQSSLIQRPYISQDKRRWYRRRCKLSVPALSKTCVLVILT